jgi:hypothetical protein
VVWGAPHNSGVGFELRLGQICVNLLRCTGGWQHHLVELQLATFAMRGYRGVRLQAAKLAAKKARQRERQQARRAATAAEEAAAVAQKAREQQQAAHDTQQEQKQRPQGTGATAEANADDDEIARALAEVEVVLSKCASQLRTSTHACAGARLRFRHARLCWLQSQQRAQSGCWVGWSRVGYPIRVNDARGG